MTPMTKYTFVVGLDEVVDLDDVLVANRIGARASAKKRPEAAAGGQVLVEQLDGQDGPSRPAPRVHGGHAAVAEDARRARKRRARRTPERAGGQPPAPSTVHMSLRPRSDNRRRRARGQRGFQDAILSKVERGHGRRRAKSTGHPLMHLETSTRRRSRAAPGRVQKSVPRPEPLAANAADGDGSNCRGAGGGRGSARRSKGFAPGAFLALCAVPTGRPGASREIAGRESVDEAALSGRDGGRDLGGVRASLAHGSPSTSTEPSAPCSQHASKGTPKIPHMVRSAMSPIMYARWSRRDTTCF